jgi:competence protein ComEA
MKRSAPPLAFDRLRAAFRPPESFGSVPGPLPPDPPEASFRAAPDDGDRIAADRSDSGWAESDLPEAGRPERHRVGGCWTAGGSAEHGRFDPGLPGVRVLALVGVLAALVAGAFLWWSRPAPRPAPQPVIRPAAHSAALAAGPAGPAGVGTPSPSQAALVVDVAGKVRRPGVVTLPGGARVIDAIKEAGGLRPGARTGTLNLARHVVDGEQILVGVTASPAAAQPGVAPGAPGAPAPGAPLDLNAATVAQLDQLPGVGPVLAQRVIDYRTQHGAFRSVDELRQVSGIGPAKFADLKGLVRV